jgi:Terpene synthase family 2, C-terminal metal binding
MSEKITGAMTAASQPGLGLSDLYLPCEPTIENPLAPAAIAVTRESASRLGLIYNRSDLERFYAFASSATYFYPSAALNQMIACSDWCAWLFFLDDQYDENVEASWDAEGARRLMLTCLACLRGVAPSAWAPPLVRFAWEIRRRLLRSAAGGERWLRRFTASAEDYLLKGVLPANAHWSHRVVPTLDHYLEQREYDSAVHTCIDLVEVAADLYIPDHVHTAEPLPTMRRLCARALAYANDLMSYEKEVLRHGNPNNLVHVLMTNGSMPFERAVHETVALINQCTRDLIALERRIPTYGGAIDKLIARYVAGLRRLLRGNYDWSLATGRYRTTESPFPELRLQGDALPAPGR